jgi:hypothetical protein
MCKDYSSEMKTRVVSLGQAAVAAGFHKDVSVMMPRGQFAN